MATTSKQIQLKTVAMTKQTVSPLRDHPLDREEILFKEDLIDLLNDKNPSEEELFWQRLMVNIMRLRGDADNLKSDQLDILQKLSRL